MIQKSKHLLLTGINCYLLWSSSLHAGTITVITTDDTNTDGTLRNAILTANPGDTITFNLPSSPSNITLVAPLPAITQSSLIISAPGSDQVTIDGAGTFSIFSIAGGNLVLENLILQNGLSLGGSGGNGNTSGGGGGGGAGGGGGLYVHTGSTVSLNGVSLSNNSAIGGAGGANTGSGSSFNAGGGGGAFGSSYASQSGNGGNGTVSSSGGGGGGGGGNTAGGNGGSNSAGVAGGSTSVIGGGGGGGSGGAAGGAAQVTTGGSPNAGGTGSSPQGGGGAGMGGVGGAASPTQCGIGGPGIGSDGFFGGGGGGGSKGTTTGGAGTGTGGGGGSFQGAGGAGGTAGGGGGAGGNTSSSAGGKGGFGGGGGGSTGTGGGTLFGGGVAASGLASNQGTPGGGGAAMGGNIFIQAQAQVTIGDSSSNRASIAGGQVTGGLAGAVAGGTNSSNPGLPYGPDLFIRSGGTVTFTNTNPLLITTNIESNQCYIDGAFVSDLGGGLIMAGTGTLTLGSSLLTTGVNTYTSSTQILSGTLQVYQDANLGATTLNGLPPGNNIIIQNGTLQTSNSFTCPRLFSLTGDATIDTTTFSPTLTGVISGPGSLTKRGSGTLNIIPAGSNINSFSGGLTIAEGIVLLSENISTDDSGLGALTKLVTMEGGTTLITTGNTATINSIRPFLLNGPATFDTETSGAGTTLILNGNITGSGSLTKTGNQDLILLGSNSYSGGTEVAIGRIVGNTSSLQGNITIDDGTTLIFLQTPTPGTFNGTLSSNLPLNSGILQIGNLNPTPFQEVMIATSNPNFFGVTNILQSGALRVNGSLANSSLMTISAGGFLGGTGTVGSINNSGIIQPGNSIGTLTVDGNLTLNGSSLLIIELSPTDSSRLAVLGNATLAGDLAVIPNISGFYGLGNNYTILTNEGTQSGLFSLPVIAPPNFITTVNYFPNYVVLSTKVGQPFLNFPFENPNEQSVGNNINALSEQGDLTPDTPLGEAINSLIGFPDTAINNALDQMHPAPFSAFAEIQAALGGQLLSLFHRRPVPHCACSNNGRLWFEPYGNWLKEKNLSYQLGFHAYSKGVAFGLDGELTDGWTLGLGAAWNDTHMYWAKGRGFSTISGYYGSIYTDYTSDNFYLGLSCIGGWDKCHSSRSIRFSTINEQAHSTRHNLELMGQLSAAFFFGPDFCFAFPYLNIDYLYLKEKEAQESGAPGLNLQVNPHSGSTLRSEAGFAVQVQDINKASTMCISPLFGLGWAMEMPINRSSYRSSFEGQPISFETHGWDYTWQLFTLRFGFSLTYRCLSLSANYVAEMSPLEHTPFFDQRGDIRLELNW
jgi:hypothetical protein